MPESPDRWDSLIRRLNAVAHDPATATDSNYPDGRAAPCLAPDEIDRAERVLGFWLPDLLRRFYTDVGNGGFGPHYGLLPLTLRTEDMGFTTLGLYEQYRDKIEWPERIVPIVEIGCGAFCCLDCRTICGREAPPVIQFEPHLPEMLAIGMVEATPYLDRWFLHVNESFAAWMTDWVQTAERVKALREEAGLASSGDQAPEFGDADIPF